MTAHLSRRGALLALLALCAVGCSRSSSGQGATKDFETTSIRYENFPNVVVFPELAEDLGFLAPLKLEYLGNTLGGPQNLQGVVTGDTDFGGAFNGAVIKLIATKAPVKAVIAYYGSDASTFLGLYVSEASAIKSPRDLIGKKVAMNTVGAHAEFVLREYLSRGGLSEAEIAQVTMLVIPPVNMDVALRQGQVDAAMHGQTFREKAVERGGLRLLVSDVELYGDFNAGSYVMSKRFLAEKPKAAHKFIEATARAIEWARVTPREQVVERMRAILARRGRGEDPELARYWRSPTIVSPGGRLSDRDFNLWIDWMVKAGQLAPGQVAAADVYTNELQPASLAIDAQAKADGAR
jgi:ABC-type nitrate/sulfonate/bicarbonate transport system substrate-binding protein